jgi:signal transduction histidine kinase
MVQDILDVSRLESGTMKFQTEDTDVNKMINEIVETMQSLADEKEMKLNMILDDNLPDLKIDSERIKQVLINLVNNSIKFSSEKSEINIKVKKKDYYLIFEVQDNGRGIPRNKIEKIFDSFYQVDCKNDRKIMGGAGLGLAISKGIVVAHGGNIYVDSKVDKGSTFSFTLPITPVEDMETRFSKQNILS